MNELKVQRNYKDTIFRMLFKDKENLLSLYNALNKTEYTDVDALEITTLENAVYMNYKNDVSFVFDYELMLYEHQSTINPNMPLRDLLPLAEAVEKAVDECIQEDVLSKFLKKNRAEAIKVSIYEYDEELHFRTLYEEGLECGIAQGESRLNQVNKLYSILLDMGRLDDLKRATQDKAYQEQLMSELLPEELLNI